jgi:cyclohexanone monooxygenase
LEACTPGYYNGEGLIDDRTTSSLPYAEGGRAMFAVLEKWRNEGDFANMKVNLKG